MSLVWGWSLPATDKLVALKLADCADDRGGNAWPAVATIAAACGLSRRGTQEVLRRLVKRGCIEVQTESTNRKSTTYRVLLDAQPSPSGGDAPTVRGASAAPLGANDVHPEGRTTCAGGAQPTTCGGAPAAPLGANQVRPIHQGSVRDPSLDPRGRARAFVGRRLKVSEKQHQVAEDESGARSAGIDLFDCYPHWDADLVASGETFDTLAYIKRRALETVCMNAPPAPQSVDWFEECRQLHGGSCGGSSQRHRTRMLLDGEKGKLVVSA